MVKAAWGKKHTCPKCGTRFYDLGRKGPAICIECEHKWVPEPILKAKQPIVAAKPEEPPAKDKAAIESVSKDANVGDEAAAIANKVDAAVGTDVTDESVAGDVGVVGDISLDDADQDLSAVIDNKLEQKGDS